jgi:2-polyprenyl-3-methyl-5-hydroxy-6-metoxy-1,4-benzoquinol methylase
MGKMIRTLRRAGGSVLRAVGLKPPILYPEAVQGLYLTQQVLPGTIRRPEGTSATGYTDLEDLSLKVAHAFEAPAALRRSYYQPLAELVGKGDRVLDIGCGDGTFLELARQRGGIGTGLDLDAEKVADCRAKGFEAHCIRVQEIEKVLTGSFDFVSLIHIIEHMPPPDALDILDSVRQSLSESGRILIVTPNIRHPQVQVNFWLDITHVRPYPQALLTSMMSALGFPYFQSGEVAYGTEVWCYGFRRPEHAARVQN